MILYPAIDLKKGQCVRLVKGDMAQATVFNADPAAQALAFVEAGAKYLHVVDLDGAIEGKPVNRAAVKAILAAIDVPVQLGGGIRDLDAVAGWLDDGINRVILGTAALEDPALVEDACAEYPDCVAVGIDARAGMVAVRGWVETSEVAAVDLAHRFEDAGVAAIIFTDIDRDGMMQGVNVAATARLAELVSIPVIASGGVSSLDDIRALKDKGIPGAILGRALYEGRIDLTAALRIAAG
ncbi:MAG: 1-(5-phosphoribosyl)-5-[(5-phosphoribosylamino)methylideneamino]imidazole-4-carboxamide isomerase [Stellaceae bacterium]